MSEPTSAALKAAFLVYDEQCRYVSAGHKEYCENVIAHALDAFAAEARREERYGCSRIVDNYCDWLKQNNLSGSTVMAIQELAEKIRARGAKA